MRLALLLLMLLALPSGAATVTIGAAFNRPPYIIEDAESGFELEVIRAAFAEMGMEVRFKFYSRKRQILFYEKGRLDGVMTISPSFGLSGYPSDIYINYFNVAISLKSRQLHLQQVMDLANYNVVAFENASLLLGGDIQTLSRRPNYREIEPQYTQNKLLYLGRADVAVADKYVFLANNALVGDEVDTSKELEFHQLFALSPYLVMFRNSIVRDAFNAGLGKLKASGKYQALQQKFLE
ncbi:transporter substrate-binding domain-containing protein [Shewanella sp. JM162201]|uniref:Transporter substrate-binding domain-containing protein n=1 Tax=Shewanella jiangmenensis TaxID=2837387 RepID=A0ABS5V4Q0_9GAMM|nr:transporter substrate-binding domain-containing protein [Shewanella jiangmenensis]MBT1445425.1 transporter substrate-binding domain-containing protein [Shewanella jiangmenensis]